MADFERLSSALRNAHKAGDTDAARKLANAIKAMRGAATAPAQAPQRQPQQTFEQRAANLTPEQFQNAMRGMDEFSRRVQGVMHAAQDSPLRDRLAKIAERPLPGESGEARRKRLHGGLSEPDVGLTEGIARSVLRGQALDGGDEIVAAGAAALDYLFDITPGDQSFSELHDARLALERDKQRKFDRTHPVTSTAATIGGALLSPVNALMPGASVGTTTAGRIGANTIFGAGVGATAGFNAGEGGLGNRLQAGGEGLVFGGLVGSGVTAGGHFVGNALARRATRRNENKLMALAPTTGQLRETGNAMFNTVPRARAREEPLSDFVEALAQRVGDEALDPTLHPNSTAAMRRLFQAALNPDAAPDLQTLRRIVSAAGAAATPDDRRIARIMREELDTFASRLKDGDLTMGSAQALREQLPEARAIWARMKKSEIIDDAVRRAGRQASGFANGIRIQFRSILNNEKLRRKFTAAEVAAMERIVRGSLADNALKRLSRLGLGNGQQSSVLTGGLGASGAAAVLGPAGPLLSIGAGQLAGNALATRASRQAALLQAMAATGQAAARGAPPRRLNALERLSITPAAAEAEDLGR